ncbi:uncharacterized protein LOC122048779 [Zingiber officinale]|uniref:uncharacterized protein LOC122048779 n=1 Tax=Zingiber officinale TaxID=94328 RepID=UPI001C4D6720|nr:uncharacterized protein LOC122048779 [Zingiber officinale]
MAYPQRNGQTEVTNQEILKDLRARLDHAGGNWVNVLPNVLWALHMTLKEATGITLFHLVYRCEAVVPMEVRVESDRVQLYDERNAERRLMKLDLVDEMWDKATVWLMAYRQRMKQNYNQRVIPRSFQVGVLVWKRIKSVNDITKLKAPCVGPYKVVQKFRSRAYYLEDEDGR